MIRRESDPELVPTCNTASNAAAMQSPYVESAFQAATREDARGVGNDGLSIFVKAQTYTS